MARPKTGIPPKRTMALTVDKATRQRLAVISDVRQESISSMLTQWSIEEAKRLNIKDEPPEDDNN